MDCSILSPSFRRNPNPIAQVACECGYASDDWFSHAFKAHTGLSPTAWRELES